MVLELNLCQQWQAACLPAVVGSCGELVMWQYVPECAPDIATPRYAAGLTFFVQMLCEGPLLVQMFM